VPWSVERAAAMAGDLLGTESERYRHSHGVAARALALSITIATDQVEPLVSAAWLHDIGYAPALRETGFHPLDGDRELIRRSAEPDLARLVAHHTAARFIAEARGLQAEMAQFAQMPGPTADALTAADQTTGPTGATMTFEHRIRRMLTRHGPHSPNARVHHRRGPELRATVERVATRLRRLGVTDRWLPPTSSTRA
jgi:hypothetical protein